MRRLSEVMFIGLFVIVVCELGWGLFFSHTHAEIHLLKAIVGMLVMNDLGKAMSTQDRKEKIRGLVGEFDEVLEEIKHKAHRAE